jgi:hypothetical protein
MSFEFTLLKKKKKVSKNLSSHGKDIASTPSSMYPDDEVGSLMITKLLHLLALPLRKTLHIVARFGHKCFAQT